MVNTKHGLADDDRLSVADARVSDDRPVRDVLSDGKKVGSIVLPIQGK